VELALVVGSVVASVKEPRLTGTKLLLVEAAGSDGRSSGGPPYIAVDLVGAGDGEVVMVTRGSPAGRALEVQGAPVDAAIVGIVDAVRAGGRSAFEKS